MLDPGFWNLLRALHAPLYCGVVWYGFIWLGGGMRELGHGVGNMGR
jgi:hypothetical protein